MTSPSTGKKPTSVTNHFLDTNILLYSATGAAAKWETANQLIGAEGVVSVQVLNEFSVNARRKYGWPWPDTREFLSIIRQLCLVVPVTEVTHDKALAIAERHQLHIYDANIWAAAILAGCDTLYSEDMHVGLTIEGVTLRDPFLD